MSQLAERYATALYDVVKTKGNVQEVLETLEALKQSLLDNKDILEILNTPLISDNDKEAVLKSAVGSGLTDELATFFKLLAKNNRLGDIPTIVTALQARNSQELGVETGVVRSAVELSGEEKQRVQKSIETKLNKKVDLQYVVEPDMIGGIEAKVGSYIFEDNIKSHMQKLNDFITRRVQ